MDSPVFWNWVPLESVGPIVFRAPAAPIIHSYDLQWIEADYVIADRDVYQFRHGETRVYVESGYIEQVMCCDEIFYQGHNILGMHVDDVRDLLGPEDEIIPGVSRIVAEFMARGEDAIYDHLGAFFWLKYSTVVTATVGPLVEDD